MASYHTVKQGEHLSSIARKYGFTDYQTIWNHAENAALKQQRQNPNVLFPGDRLFIPDRQGKTEPGSTEQRHRFQVRRQKLKLQLVLEDMYEKPIANAKCELHIENETHALTTNGQGRIELDIPPDAESAFLIVKDPQTPVNEVVMPIKIGHLDPVEEVSGQRARLNNLGYFAGPLAEKDDAGNEELFRSAVEEFQCDHNLVVDGKCGPITQAKLKDVHGC